MNTGRSDGDNDKVTSYRHVYFTDSAHIASQRSVNINSVHKNIIFGPEEKETTRPWYSIISNYEQPP